MNKNGEKLGAIIKLCIWSLVLILLVTTLVYGLSSSGCEGSNGSMYAGGIYDNPESYSVGGAEYSDTVTAIDINWGLGAVEISAYDGETLTASEDYSGDDSDTAMRVKLENGRLTVKFAASGIRIFNGYTDKKLTVKVPKKMLEGMNSIEIDSMSAEIDIQGITARKLDIDTASGDISVLSSSFDLTDIEAASSSMRLEGEFITVSAETASGDLHIKGSLRELDWETASGDCLTELAGLPEKIEAETASGNVTVNSPIAPSGFTLIFDGMSGNARIKRADGSESIGNRLSAGDGKYTYKMETASGSFIFNESPAISG